MEQKTSNFQIAILIIFSFFIVLGVILFSTSKFKPDEETFVSPVVMWGTISSESINKLIELDLEKNKNSLKITYVQKSVKTFEKDLVEAIADGIGPDMIVVPHDMIQKNINKFTVIPFASYPLRTFYDQFIDASSAYVAKDGILAIPFVIDPMVMYWNKTHFANAGIVNPPKEWDEFSTAVQKLTSKDVNSNVLRSGVAMGEYQNVLHAKDILSMLFIQAGVPIVTKKANEDTFDAYIYFNSNNSVKPPAVIALSFYTDFANPSKDLYSWNRSLKPSFDSFISGDTSIYFGYSSELPSITLKNPNLNFDVTQVPQVKDTKTKAVLAKMYGIAILKSSKNQLSAFNQIAILTSKDSIESFSNFSNLPPVRKDVLSIDPADAFMKIFNDSALISKTWPDPNQAETELVFKNMIESVVSGKSSVDVAASVAENEMRNIIRSNFKF